MKITGTLLISAGIIIGVVYIIFGVKANYEYTSQFKSYWDLSDKSSTIAQKSDYLDQFVTALQNSGLQGTNDTLWYSTPSNSFDANLKALESLQSRMRDIKGMNESSLEYQQAISQITAQEQGQADSMLGTLEGCWWKVHHYIYWNIFTMLGISIGSIALMIVGIILLIFY